LRKNRAKFLGNIGHFIELLSGFRIEPAIELCCTVFLFAKLFDKRLKLGKVYPLRFFFVIVRTRYGKMMRGTRNAQYREGRNVQTPKWKNPELGYNLKIVYLTT